MVYRLLEKIFCIPDGGVLNISELYTLIIGIKLIAFAIGNYDKIVQKLENMKNTIYYNYIAPKISGNYEVNIVQVGNMASEIGEVEKKLRADINEVETLIRNLNYCSASSGYYKSTLYVIKNGLESDLDKLKTMAGIANYAVQRYQTVDEQVKISFE